MDFPEFTRLLTNTCETKKSKKTEQATGQMKVEWVSVETGIACLIRTLSGSRDDSILGRIASATHKLYMSEGHTVEQGYQIIIGTDKYVVRENKTPDEIKDFNDQHHHTELVLEKVVE